MPRESCFVSERTSTSLQTAERNAALPLLAKRAGKLPQGKKFHPKCRPVKMSDVQLEELRTSAGATAVIIFLAGGSNGFTQPLVWKHWRESHPANIAFSVYVDPESEETVPSSQMGHWVSKVSCMGFWGGYNLVKVEAQMLESVLNRYKQAEHIYVVSVKFGNTFRFQVALLMYYEHGHFKL